ncbi:MAG: hypothetical protein K0U36_05715 [Alphaproteobacteria bacterium]|nr:hypothetical protein [Alphaproteobacteria bacterium]
MCAHFGKLLSIQSQFRNLIQYEHQPFDHKVQERGIEGVSPDILESHYFQFQVVYTFVNDPESSNSVRFVDPDSKEGKGIRNVILSDVGGNFTIEPSKVVSSVKEKHPEFNMPMHTKAAKYFEARPFRRDEIGKIPTKKEWCYCKTGEGDTRKKHVYYYSQAWIDHLIEALDREETLQAIKQFGKKKQ